MALHDQVSSSTLYALHEMRTEKGLPLNALLQGRTAKDNHLIQLCIVFNGLPWLGHLWHRGTVDR